MGDHFPEIDLPLTEDPLYCGRCGEDLVITNSETRVYSCPRVMHPVWYVVEGKDVWTLYDPDPSRNRIK